MASPAEPAPDTEWEADDVETDSEMNEDDFEYDALDEQPAEGDADEERGAAAGSATTVPVWRLIEMSREDRKLKRELADFEDYDNHDRFDDYAGLPY